MVRTRANARETYSTRYHEPFRGLPPELRRMIWSFTLDDEITVRPVDCRCKCTGLFLNSLTKPPDTTPIHSAGSHPRVLIWLSSRPRRFKFDGGLGLLQVSHTVKEETMELLDRRVTWDVSEMTQPCAMVRFMRLMPETYYRSTRGLIISCHQLFMLTELAHGLHVSAFSSLRSPYRSRYPADEQPIDLIIDVTLTRRAFNGEYFIFAWRKYQQHTHDRIPKWVGRLADLIRFNVIDKCEFRFNDPGSNVCATMSDIARVHGLHVTQDQLPRHQVYAGKLSYVYDQGLRRASLFMTGRIIEVDD